MAYNVSGSFKNAIKSNKTAKSCLIVFDDLFFSTSDFTDGGVEFNQFFNASDDLTYGDCPSDTLSFSVVANGNLSGYGFGKAQAYLGVQFAHDTYVFGDINAHIEVGGNTYTASNSGLYRNDTKISSAVYVSLVSDGTYVYAIGANYSSKVYNATGAIVAYTPNRFMAQKLQTPLSAVFSANMAYVWDGENVLMYEYAPMGVYNIDKPRSTVGDVVAVQDAYDDMIRFDVDAAEFINSLSYPCTLSQIYTALCNYVGVSYDSSTFTYSSTSYNSSPFSESNCSCRDILWWIAERARRIAHFNRVGQLTLMPISTTTQETLTASDIEQDGYSVAEFMTPAVTGVLLRGTNGSTLTFGANDTPYVISSNPFVSTISNSDLQAYWAIPRYVPMELNVLEADPSIDVGDFVNIKPMVDEVKLLTDVYGQVYATLTALTIPNTDDIAANNGTALARVEAYAMDSPTYAIPIMNRTINFIGAIRAKYTATGNEQREADISVTEYNADVAANMAKDYTDKLDDSLNQQSVFDRLTNNGQEQGIYLANGKIYVNAEYIKTGTLSADYIYGGTISGSAINLGNGVFTVDNSGSITATAGQIGGFTIANSKLTGSSVDIDPTGILTVEDVGGVLVSKIEIFSEYTSGSNTINDESRMRSNAIYQRSTVKNSGGTVTAFKGTKVDAYEIKNWQGTNESTAPTRFKLDATGLYFYNSSGVLTKTYSAT